jgi:hypothetical protein
MSFLLEAFDKIDVPFLFVSLIEKITDVSAYSEL